MFSKLKSTTLIFSVLTILCFALNFIGNNSLLYAQDAQSTETKPQSKDCPLGKAGKPACKSSSVCGSKHGGCCGHAKACYQGSHCGSKHGHGYGCGNPCKKGSGYGHGGGHSASDMLGLVHCAKKELLKEKIKTKLNAKMGPKLDKVADLLVDAMLEEYKAGRASKERRSELEKKMIEIFSGKAAQ